MGTDVNTDADELYGLPVDRFTEARDTLAKELAASGDKAAAGEVRRLRKPSRAAWLANVFARRHPEEITTLLNLGADLRRAQSDARGDDLRVLSSRRQVLIRRVLQLLSEDAGVGGTPLATATQRQFVATLEAAMADESAGLALAAGRLTDALSHVGFGGDSAPDRPGVHQLPTKAGQDSHAGTPRGQKRRRDALERMQKRLTDARTAMDAATVALDQARARHESAGARYREVAAELQKADQRLQKASRELRKATTRQERDERTLGATESEVRKRRASLSDSGKAQEGRD